MTGSRRSSYNGKIPECLWSNILFPWSLMEAVLHVISGDTDTALSAADVAALREKIDIDVNAKKVPKSISFNRLSGFLISGFAE